MSYEFKKLSDTEMVSTVGDSASILIEENGVIKRAPKDEVGGGIKVASTAKVGQTIVVKAVDENGNPTEWECADKGDQADWNENDETSMAYIRNRPFGNEMGKEIYYAAQTVNCVNSSSGMVLPDDNRVFGNLEQTEPIPWDGVCTIIFDDVVYENIEAYEDGGDMCVYVDFTTQNGDIIRIGVDFNTIAVPDYLAGEHTIEVFKPITIVKQLDSKFIPYILNSSTAGSTKRFRITVDDSGTLSAVEVTE